MKPIYEPKGKAKARITIEHDFRTGYDATVFIPFPTLCIQWATDSVPFRRYVAVAWLHSIWGITFWRKKR